jgi:surface antigen
VLGLFGPLLVSPASASGDDYPYRADRVNRADRWGFTTRQCVSFAAWRLAQRHHPISNASGWGSAYRWDNVAHARGVTITGRPKVGAIAQWNAYERSAYYSPTGGVGSFRAGGYGHVAYVSGVYGDGSVRVEQYNVAGTRTYSAMRVKAPRYLYLS